MGALSHLFVLDFSTLLPGPLASLLLAEAGAEVLKIERPETGDDMRRFKPLWGTDGVNFALLNRGKKSLTLDLKDDAARETLVPLIKRADILIEQFRPGVMARLGLSYAEAKAIKPDIVYCSITGYGQTGPKSADAAHDLNYLAETGMLSLSCGDLYNPVIPPALIADIAGGAYPAMMNILLALSERDRGHGGRHLDISMSDNLFPMLYWALGQGAATGVWPKNGTELVTGGSPRYRLYVTLDNKLVAAAPIEEQFWVRFCELIALPEPFRSSADDVAVSNQIAAIIATKRAAAWAAIFHGIDCCCCIVATLEEALENPHFQSRGLFNRTVTNAEGNRIPALPLPLDRSFICSPDDSGAPGLGTDSALFS